jgi:N-methylhydantoinase B
VRADNTWFTCAYTRNTHPPWSIKDGLDGSPNYVEVIRADGSRETHAVVTGLRVDEGDVIRIHTGNGGGYGDPRRRSRDKVVDDVRNGFITEEEAASIYGLTDADDQSTLPAATRV